jgi:hypothetical protein
MHDTLQDRDYNCYYHQARPKMNEVAACGAMVLGVAQFTTCLWRG